LIQKEAKKIKAANKKAEIFNTVLQSRNSLEELTNLQIMRAQTALIA
jgi:hypothetical protein